MLPELLHYCRWADQQFWIGWRAYLRDSALPIDLHERLHHIHFTQRAFADMLTTGSYQYQPAEAFDSSDAIEEMGHEAMQRIIDASQTRDLDHERLYLPWFGEPRFEPVLREALTQVTLHTQHHRAQNILLLTKAGGSVPKMEFTNWVRQGRPQA